MHTISKESIRAWAHTHEPEMVEDVMRLVRIPSVSQNCNAPESPYGEACAHALDEGLSMCRKYGLETKDIGRQCGIALWKGQTDKTIGIFGHLDVVPAGSGWDTPPYKPVVSRGYILGRGASDNKGPTVAALYAMRCLREQGVQLKHGIQLYLGCNEEAGMSDIHYFTSHEPQPVFCLVPDVSFPVCCGEKGTLTADLVCNISGSNLIEFSGGIASNSVPDAAHAVLSGFSSDTVQVLAEDCNGIICRQEGPHLRIDASGIAGHAAFPEGTESAIQKLAAFLSYNHLATGPAASAISFLADAFSDAYGKGLDIDFSDDISGKTTHIGGMVHLENNHLVQNINVRYAIQANPEKLIAQLHARCEAAGFAIEHLHNDPPYYTSPSHPAVPFLLRAYQDVYGGPAEPYVMGGGTYARKLKNAVGFGPGMPALSSPFGGGHQPNEGMCIELLTNMVEIYANTLLAIDSLTL